MKTYSLFSTWLRVGAAYASVAFSLLVTSLAWPQSAPPLLGRFIFTGDLNTARAFHTATLLRDGRVLVAGGYTDGSLRSAELYDPRSGTWTLTGDLITARNAQLVATVPYCSTAMVGNAEPYDCAQPNKIKPSKMKNAKISSQLMNAECRVRNAE